MKIICAKTACSLFALFSLSANWASASIGKDTRTINDDCESFKGKLSIVVADRHFACQAARYKVDFFTDKNGTVKRISWVGQATPSFDLLLGDFNEEYRQIYRGSSTKNRLQRNVTHETANLTVKRGGHARLHYGSITLKNRD